MRKLRSHEVIGLSVDAILQEFNEQASELGLTEENLVSVSVNPPRHALQILDGDKIRDAKVQVTFIYWSER